MGGAALVEHSTDNAVCGRWRNLYITEWRQKAKGSELTAIYDLQRRYLESAPRLASMSVVQSSALGMVDAEVRAAIDGAARTIMPKTAAIALCVQGSGFGGAIIRSVLTGMNLFTRQKCPMQVVKTVEQACDFIAQYVDGKPSIPEIAAAYREIVAAPIWK